MGKQISSALQLKQLDTPADPPSGETLLYVKSDNKVYTKTSAGAEAEVGTGAGLPARLGTTAQVVTDWNDATENGFYAAGNTATNAPTANYYGGIVKAVTSSYLEQILFDYNSATGAADTKTYRRMRVNGTWGSWHKLAMSITEITNLDAVRAATYGNITLSGTQTVDGVSVVAGDVVLVKDQTTAADNGIYTVAAGSWTRTAPMNTAAGIAGARVRVLSGSQYGGQLWHTKFKSTDTLGTTALTWARVAVGDINTEWTNLQQFKSTGSPAPQAFLQLINRDEATAGSPSQRSPGIELSGSYWDGAASQDRTIAINHYVGAYGTVNALQLWLEPYYELAVQFGLPGHIEIDNVGYNYGSGLDSISGFLKVQGMLGSSAVSRYVGATSSGAPASGTFAVGDFIIDRTGKIWVCTIAGTPGIWADVAGARIANSLVDAKGDLLVGTANDTVARKAVGANATVLIADSTQSDGLKWHADGIVVFGAKVATTANITLSGTQTVNGVSLSVGDICLVKNQTSSQDNGVYVVASGSWTRHPMFDTATKIAGAVVRQLAGTIDGGLIWHTNFKSTDTLGTTAMAWSSPYSDLNPPETLQRTNYAAASVSTPPSGQTNEFTQDGRTLDMKDSSGNVWNIGSTNVVVATTANITLSGTQTIDGVSVAAGDLVLVKNQSTAANNGVYVCAAGSWSRAPGFDHAAGVAWSDLICVLSGTLNGGSLWTTPFKSTDTLGTTAQPWLQLSAGTCEAYPFFMTGTCVVATGKSRIYLEGGYVVETIRASVNTAPTGASLIVDVNKNGTTIYTTQGNRPTIAASGFTATGNSPDVTTFAAGDYITVDVDQIGSTVAGADLTVTIRLRRTN